MLKDNRSIFCRLLLLLCCLMLTFPVTVSASTKKNANTQTTSQTKIKKAVKKKKKEPKWKVTQYKSKFGPVICYTIIDAKNRLVIIDGGYAKDSNRIRKIIEEHGNKVYAWIITHPHPDHVGAFNAIMKADKKHKIKIGTIYTTPYNLERYRETAKTYDKFSVCEQFDLLLQKQKKVVYLKKGDTFQLMGLQGKVYNSWNEKTDAFEEGLCNLGSLMFKLSGKKSSILFCGDTQSEIEGDILDEYGDELASDYVQCAHHGNWGMTTDFYAVVKPKAAFMDAPEDIVKYEFGNYNGYVLYKYFRNNNVKVYRFRKKPNTIVLR